MFVDGIDQDNVNEELDTQQNEEYVDGDTELMEAIRAIKAAEESDEDDEFEDDLEEDAETDTEEDNEDDTLDSEDDEVETDEQKGQKREQSKEENARFAAQRRQQELDAKVQAEIARLQAESPEYRLAKQLSDMYGTTPDVILEQMKEAALQKEATEKNLPIELLRDRQAEKDRLASVEEELNQLRFTAWENKIETEKSLLQTKYSVLDEADFTAATDYLLYDAASVDMSLEQAVYALHGAKIVESLANAKAQDKLAADGGRKKKTPPSPNNGKALSTTKGATAEEKYIAKQMGISINDYLKYK
jgi:hypothetical protein